MMKTAGYDILPQDIWKWRHIEKTLHLMAEEYNFEEIRTSIIQPRSVIESAFPPFRGRRGDPRIRETYYGLNGDGDLGLRIENTVAILNSALAANTITNIRKLYYQGPVFPRTAKPIDRPYHHQFGFEILGLPSVIAEIELMRIGHRICRRLGIPNPIIVYSSYGCSNCRPAYAEALDRFRAEHPGETCRNCLEPTVFYPMQTRDCEQEACQQLKAEAPKITDYLCESCREELHYVDRVLSNLSTEHELDPYMVQPFGYYNRLVFRVVSKFHNKRCQIGSGGRYDTLSEELGRGALPAVGFSLNLEDMISWLESNHLFNEPIAPFRVYACSNSPELDLILLQLTQELHDHYVYTVQESNDATIEEVIDRAGERRCSVIIWLREDVIRDGKVWFVNLEKEYEELIDLSDILNHILRIRKSVQIEA